TRREFARRQLSSQRPVGTTRQGSKLFLTSMGHPQGRQGRPTWSGSVTRYTSTSSRKRNWRGACLKKLARSSGDLTSRPLWTTASSDRPKTCTNIWKKTSNLPFPIAGKKTSKTLQRFPVGCATDTHNG